MPFGTVRFFVFENGRYCRSENEYKTHSENEFCAYKKSVTFLIFHITLHSAQPTTAPRRVQNKEMGIARFKCLTFVFDI